MWSVAKVIFMRLLPAVAVLAVLGFVYHWVYERGVTDAQEACEAERDKVRLAAREIALSLMLRDLDTAAEAQEALDEQRKLAERYRSALDDARTAVPDCHLDEYRLCLAQSAARGAGPEVCAELRDGEGASADAVGERVDG